MANRFMRIDLSQMKQLLGKHILLDDHCRDTLSVEVNAPDSGGTVLDLQSTSLSMATRMFDCIKSI